MRIEEALPQKKYIAAALRAKTPEFQALKQRTIERVQGWYEDPRIDKITMPGLWFGYGKDSMATAIILELADLDYCILHLDNGSDLPQHQAVIPDWEEFIGYELPFEKYVTNEPIHLIIKKYLDWGNFYGLKTKEGHALSFWNWGEMRGAINYESSYQFDHLYGEGISNIMYLWGNRGSEGMERQFEIRQMGMLQFRDQEKKDHLPWVRALPLGDWLDRDVWALLVEQDAPISPIYSFHEIPQKKGGKSFPRTLGACDPSHLCSQFYRWMARYAPVQLKELCDVFPEIPDRLTTKESD